MPPPLSVTLLPPSMTIFGPVSLKILAVGVSVMVTGSGPQSKVMMPPLATADDHGGRGAARGGAGADDVVRDARCPRPGPRPGR